MYLFNCVLNEHWNLGCKKTWQSDEKSQQISRQQKKKKKMHEALYKI